jgi:hypothetical protein
MIEFLKYFFFQIIEIDHHSVFQLMAGHVNIHNPVMAVQVITFTFVGQIKLVACRNLKGLFYGPNHPFSL